MAGEMGSESVELWKWAVLCERLKSAATAAASQGGARQ